MDIRDPNLSVNLTAFRALQAEVARLDALAAALRSEIDHAAINDLRLPAAFGKRQGDAAVRANDILAVLERFAK